MLSWRVNLRPLGRFVRYSDKCLISRVINLINHAGRNQSEGGSGGDGQRELIPLLNIRSTLGPLSAPLLTITGTLPFFEFS